MRMQRTLLMVMVVALATACGSDGPGSWTGTITDSANVQIINNPAEGLWAPGEAWTLTETLRIGSIDEYDYQFGNINGIAKMDDGRIMVFDQQAQQLKVFSETGVFDRAIGGPGSGPGEFLLGAGPVLVASDGSVHVPDLQNQRVNRFSPEGEEAGSYPVRFSDGFPIRWESNADGRFVMQLRRVALPGQEPIDDPYDYILARNGEGEVTDTIFTMESGGSLNFGGSSPEIKLFAPEPIWALGHDNGVVAGLNEEYRIGQYDAAGQLMRIIARAFELAPVTDSDQEIIIQSLQTLFGQSGVPPQAMEQLLSIIKFGEFYPAFAQLAAGPSGTTWIQRIQRPSELTDEQRMFYNPQTDLGSDDWDVFDTQGRYLGVVSMPSRFTFVRFYGNEILGVARDDVDVQYVVTLRVDGAGLEQT